MKSYTPKLTTSRWVDNIDGSGFRFIKRVLHVNSSRSKYAPHVGKKQLKKQKNDNH